MATKRKNVCITTKYILSKFTFSRIRTFRFIVSLVKCFIRDCLTSLETVSPTCKSSAASKNTTRTKWRCLCQSQNWALVIMLLSWFRIAKYSATIYCSMLWSWSPSHLDCTRQYTLPAGLAFFFRYFHLCLTRLIRVFHGTEIHSTALIPILTSPPFSSVRTNDSWPGNPQLRSLFPPSGCFVWNL